MLHWPNICQFICELSVRLYDSIHLNNVFIDAYRGSIQTYVTYKVQAIKVILGWKTNQGKTHIIYIFKPCLGLGESIGNHIVCWGLNYCIWGPISKVRLSNHFKFFKPSTIEMISASVDDGDPKRVVGSFLTPRRTRRVWGPIQCDYCHHGGMPKKRRNEG